MADAARADLKIGFIGTGLMGAPMARNILRAGFALTAWNRSPAKAEALVTDGATVAASIADAVAGADVVITMLADGATVTEVYFDGGAVAAARPGTVFADMSSIPPSVARDHAARLAELGISHIDAPVSGGTVGAAEASLAIMAGGEAAAIERVRPVFEAMGRPIRVGPHGAGQLAKLANQAIVAVTIGAVAEGLMLAAAGGADPAAVRDAIRGGYAESRVLEIHGGRMVGRNFVPGGPSKFQLKDLETVLAAAAESGVELPLTRNVRDRFVKLVRDMGGADYDHSALLLELEAENAPKRVGTAPDKLPG